MKKTGFVLMSFLFAAPQAFAHGMNPVLGDLLGGGETAYESALHNAGYAEADFDDVTGVAVEQDLARKVRVVRFRFGSGHCSKDLEVYLKLDGSVYLAHKVIGCAP